MEKQQAALEETLMGKRMTPGALEAAGGSSRSKQGFKPVLALVAVMALLIVVLVAAFTYCFLQNRETASCDQPAEEPPASDPGALMANCPWKESDREKMYDIFTADDSDNYLVYGWVKFSEATHQQLTLIHSDKSDTRDMTMTTDQTRTVFFVVEKMSMIKNTTLSLSVPGNLKSCTGSRFHVSKV